MTPRACGLRLTGSNRLLTGWLIVATLGLPLVAAVWSVTGNRWQDQAASPMVAFSFVAVGVLAAVLARADPWLGAFLAWGAMRVLLTPTLAALGTLEYLVSGALVIFGVRQLGAPGRVWLIRAVGAMTLFQVTYQLVQVAGYDPLWFGWDRRTDLLPMGTVRTTNGLGAYFALAIPLVSPWIAGIGAVGLVLTNAFTALVAAGAAALVRWPRLRRPWGLALLGVGAGVVTAVWLMRGTHPALSVSTGWRWAAWQRGLVDWWQRPVLGHGWGAWATRVGLPQTYLDGGGTLRTRRDAATHAFNEYVQVLHEAGLPALGIVGAWGWTHRQAFLQHGSLVALAIVALGFSPFYLAIPGWLACLVIGLSTPQENPDR